MIFGIVEVTLEAGGTNNGSQSTVCTHVLIRTLGAGGDILQVLTQEDRNVIVKLGLE